MFARNVALRLRPNSLNEFKRILDSQIIPFRTTVALQILTAVVFAVSLQLLKTSPRMTIASITETNPRTESL